jgi:hypothetical protein
MLLVNQRSVGQRADFPCCLNGAFRQIRPGFEIVERVNPRAGVFCAASILRDGDDFKILVL